MSLVSALKTAALLAATVALAGVCHAAPSITLAPATGDYSVNDTVTVTINLDTDTGAASGAGVWIYFDPNVFELPNGNADIVKDSGSPYNLTPLPAITNIDANNTKIEIALLEPSVNAVSYTGAAATIAFKAIATGSGSVIALSGGPDSSRFSPTLAGTTLTNATYNVSSDVSDWYLY